MSQHDQVLANQAGAAFRSDANDALAALFSNNSGLTAPATTVAYMWWPDTTTGLLKQRNAANSAWITIGTMATTNLALLALTGGTLTGALTIDKGSTGDHGIIGNTLKGHLTENGTSFGLLHASTIAGGTGVSFTATTAALQVAGTSVLTVTSSGGTFVGNFTGATSIQTGTGTGATAGLKTINGSAGAGSGYFGIYAENLVVSSSNFAFAGYYDGTISFQNATTTAYMSISAAAKITVTAGASSTSGVQLNAYTTNGTVTTTGTTGVLSSASDARLKRHEAYFSGGRDKLRNLRARYYYWLHELEIEKESEGHIPAQRQLGFFAQDVNASLGDEAANPPPWWNPDSPWGYYDRSVLAAVVQALNELGDAFDAYKVAHP